MTNMHSTIAWLGLGLLAACTPVQGGDGLVGPADPADDSAIEDPGVTPDPGNSGDDNATYDPATLRSALDNAGVLSMLGMGETGAALPPPGRLYLSGTAGEEAYDGMAFQTVRQSYDGDDWSDTVLAVWRGLDEKTETFDELILVFAQSLVDPGSVDLGSDVEVIGGSALVWTSDNKPGGFAAIFFDESESLAVSTAGELTIDTVTLGDEEPCPDVDDPRIDCTVAEGTLDGDFDFDAEAVDTEDTYERDADFSLPVVRGTFSFNN